MDIILHLVNSPIVDIAANGAAVLCDTIDIEQARLPFENGCVANVTASRISQKTKRKMRFFQNNACVCVDFKEGKVSHFYKGDGEMYPGIAKIECAEQIYGDGDALKLEIEDFLHCVQASAEPKVSGEAGRDALSVSHTISDLIASQRR